MLCRPTVPETKADFSLGVLFHSRGGSCHFAAALSPAEIRSSDLHRCSGKIDVSLFMQ